MLKLRKKTNFIDHDHKYIQNYYFTFFIERISSEHTNPDLFYPICRILLIYIHKLCMSLFEVLSDI